MSRVVHFEIAADDPERASKFYSDAFGWSIKKWDGPVPYWMVDTGEGEPGINGGIAKRDKPGEGTNTVVGVESVDAALAKVQAAGGKVTSPKHAIPGMGWLAYCTDTEGNEFGMMQPDESAK
jgi:uncharacterized protein